MAVFAFYLFAFVFLGLVGVDVTQDPPACDTQLFRFQRCRLAEQDGCCFFAHKCGNGVGRLCDLGRLRLGKLSGGEGFSHSGNSGQEFDQLAIFAAALTPTRWVAFSHAGTDA